MIQPVEKHITAGYDYQFQRKRCEGHRSSKAKMRVLNKHLGGKIAAIPTVSGLFGLKR